MRRGAELKVEEKRATRQALAEAIVVRAHLESVIGGPRTAQELRDLADATGWATQALLSLGIRRGARGLTQAQLRLVTEAMLRLAALPR